ncbi:phosphonate metabolism transcriptional regulator PhnF [Peribacillus acanthi]|uniref:phosphonate metabolism transcriptional regulator PhnF n=1 Tax=Peribacillus acanthi TaxID=2171554 RepID=UPI000D3EC50F|nr:phosphonate metabolism transcriptional regulator PhnF [Peribacillus acanthi]
MINKQSPVPIYFQLEEWMKQQIEDGKWKAGRAIPSERELSEQFKVSRMTVRQALANLVQEGILLKKKGLGTFVKEQKLEQVLLGLTSFSEEMLKRGMTPKSILINFEKITANPLVASQLAIHTNEEVFRIERIRLADDVPMAFETAYLPAHLFGEMTKEDAYGSLYDYLQTQKGLKIQEAKQDIEALLADTRLAEFLQIKVGAPILQITRTAYLQTGTPFEYVRTAFRGDRYRFNHQVTRY